MSEGSLEKKVRHRVLPWKGQRLTVGNLFGNWPQEQVRGRGTNKVWPDEKSH